jgi:hypothetical protein
MCQSIKEASGELCCVVDMVLWPIRIGSGIQTDLHVDLFHLIYILLAYEKLFMQSVQQKILLYYSNK